MKTGKIKVVAKELRIRHYIKNLLIFIPPVFSGQLLQKSLLLRYIGGFFVFCLMSSSVYIFNDLRDLREDRLHSRKKNRPLAAGLLSSREVVIYMLVMFLLALFLNLYVSDTRILIHSSYVFLLAYVFINVLYSFGLKNVPIIDICLLAVGFILRMYYGGAIGDIKISNWTFFTILTGALYLSMGKRRNELLYENQDVRKSLTGYSVQFLEKNMYMCLGLCIMFYALSCMDNHTVVAGMGVNLVWTVPVVIIICLRYNLCIEQQEDGDPVSVIWRDKVLSYLILIYFAVLLFTIYSV